MQLRKQKADYRLRKNELENRIELLEAEEKDIQRQIEDPVNAVDPEILTDLCERLDFVKNQLGQFIDEYLEQYAD